MKKSFLIGSIVSFVLCVLSFIYYVTQQELTMATRRVTESYGGLSVEMQITLLYASLIVGIALLSTSVVLLVLAIKKRGKAL